MDITTIETCIEIHIALFQSFMQYQFWSLSITDAISTFSIVEIRSEYANMNKIFRLKLNSSS